MAHNQKRANNLHILCKLFERKLKNLYILWQSFRAAFLKKIQETRQKSRKSTKYLTENLSSEQKGERKDEKSNVKSANGRKNRKRNY